MSPDPNLRRVDDQRFTNLDSKVDEVAKEVRSIREMLITEPEASPLGRALLKKSIENRALLDKHHEEFRAFVRDDFQPLDDWWNQSRGAWKLILGAATILGIIGTFFGITAYIGGI